MARVSKSDRQQAVRYIKKSLEGTIEGIQDRNREEFDYIRQQVSEGIEDEYGFDRIVEEIVFHRQIVDDLEKELASIFYDPNNRWSSPSLVRDKMVNAEAETRISETVPGALINVLRKEISDVERKVFLATTHEELVEIIKELS